MPLKCVLFIVILVSLLTTSLSSGGYREHDILVVGQDGEVENITKFPFGPDHNVIPM